MFKRILVPIDGGSTSNRGFEQAVSLAKIHGATLYLLNVVDEHVIVQHTEGMGTLTEQFIESMRRSGQVVLDKAKAAASRAGVDCRTVLVENIASSVADMVVQQAKKQRVDVIVMGTHGRRGVRRLVMGSDAEGVVRNSPVPVLLVRGGTKRRAAS